MKRRVSAYFTVEATLVLNIVLGVLLILIYIMFYQYDRCLLEQDIGALALKGCSLQAADKEGLMLQLKKHESQIYQDKYIAWKSNDIDMELAGGSVLVKQSGTVEFPFRGIGIQSAEMPWAVTASYENQRISPTSFLRKYRKITGGE